MFFLARCLMGPLVQGLYKSFLGLEGLVGMGNILGVGGAFSQASAQREANAQNIALAREQMGFQKEMSNSAYQRVTEDLGKAGLNPMLAISQGSASTPSGASTSVEPVSEFNNVAKATQNATASAMEAMSWKQDLENKTLAGRGLQLENESQAIDNAISTAKKPAAVKHAAYDEKYAAEDAIAKRLTGGSLVDKGIKAGTYSGRTLKKGLDAVFGHSARNMDRYRFNFNKPDYSRSTGKGDFYPDKYPESKSQDWKSGMYFRNK